LFHQGNLKDQQHSIAAKCSMLFTFNQRQLVRVLSNRSSARLAQLVIALLQGASTRQNFRPRYQQQVANAQAQTLVFLGQ
jgi:hypothetical protein